MSGVQAPAFTCLLYIRQVGLPQQFSLERDMEPATEKQIAFIKGLGGSESQYV